MTIHTVNRGFALAARETQAQIVPYLTRVLTPVFGDDAEQTVDEIAGFMCKNIKSGPRVETTFRQTARAHKRTQRRLPK
ncbi:MAG: hypothetical protein UY70_C0017G0007 [Candidatus Kaiserbacteria bacterium GW2011_GWB1_52_6]|uniref:Uncharacterized protein n=1 Tax=Candidatus Kaiserbacteria bacterium GW2011_GWB1_52_6 TaxID=1618674 RepID=A0A0G1ZH83_9BACT|nr:MAG: hypothetical protein UY70_C0017G0007 [Candidatus Kaiserbacteria bacterium GW2011_GWB1_52_6]